MDNIPAQFFSTTGVDEICKLTPIKCAILIQGEGDNFPKTKKTANQHNPDPAASTAHYTFVAASTIPRLP
jgi:hypothetical protein